MKRRTLITTLGGLAGAGSLMLGTSAFTSVRAERAVTVTVADDSHAFLRMEPVEDAGLDSDDEGSPELTGRSSTNGSLVQFQLPGDEEGENSNAEGLGLDSIYEFHDLLEIVNQGTQPVEVYSTYDGDTLADLALVRDSGILRDDPLTLGVGDHLVVGLYIDTHGSSINRHEETLTIVADQPN